MAAALVFLSSCPLQPTQMCLAPTDRVGLYGEVSIYLASPLHEVWSFLSAFAVTTTQFPPSCYCPVNCPLPSCSCPCFKELVDLKYASILWWILRLLISLCWRLHAFFFPLHFLSMKIAYFADCLPSALSYSNMFFSCHWHSVLPGFDTFVV